jgi:hypothetical protein
MRIPRTRLTKTQPNTGLNGEVDIEIALIHPYQNFLLLCTRKEKSFSSP